MATTQRKPNVKTKVGSVRPKKAATIRYKSRAQQKKRVGVVGKPTMSLAPTKKVGVSLPGTSSIIGSAKPVGLNEPAPSTGGTAAPAPAAPKAPAAPVPQGLQYDAQYYNEIDEAERAEREGQLRTDAQEIATKREFGIEDPTDPFSRMAGLKRIYLQNKAATTNSMAAAGQLYSGAHEGALAAGRYAEEQDLSSLRKNYEAALGTLAERRAKMRVTLEDARRQALESLLGRQPEPDVPLEETPEEDLIEAELDADEEAVTGHAPGPPVAVGSKPQAPGKPKVVSSKPQPKSKPKPKAKPKPNVQVKVGKITPVAAKPAPKPQAKPAPKPQAKRKR